VRKKRPARKLATESGFCFSFFLFLMTSASAAVGVHRLKVGCEGRRQSRRAVVFFFFFAASMRCFQNTRKEKVKQSRFKTPLFSPRYYSTFCHESILFLNGQPSCSSSTSCVLMAAYCKTQKQKNTYKGGGECGDVALWCKMLDSVKQCAPSRKKKDKGRDALKNTGGSATSAVVVWDA
jgi:hypothetical protein